jgi:hypothetical protein
VTYGGAGPRLDVLPEELGRAPAVVGAVDKVRTAVTDPRQKPSLDEDTGGAGRRGQAEAMVERHHRIRLAMHKQ